MQATRTSSTQPSDFPEGGKKTSTRGAAAERGRSMFVAHRRDVFFTSTVSVSTLTVRAILTGLERFRIADCCHREASRGVKKRQVCVKI